MMFLNYNDDIWIVQTQMDAQSLSRFKKERTSKLKQCFSAFCFTAEDVVMACGIGSAGESCILTSQYPQGLAAWQSEVQRAPPSADRSVPPESESKRSKVSVHYYERER